MEKRTNREDPSTHEMLARACSAVGAALTSDALQPEQWLKDTCAQLVDVFDEQVAAQAWVDLLESGEERGRTLYAAVAGLPALDPSPASLQASRSGSAGGQEASGGAQGTVVHAIARKSLFADSVWQASSVRRMRLAIGLHEFARATVSVELAEGPGAMSIQLDGLSATWRPDNLTLWALEAVAPAMSRGFAKRFVEPARRRSELLGRLSETQKLIAPLLAAGYTEREAAERLERSMHTIHEHTREIYRAFGVRSRMEMRDVWMGLRPAPGSSRPATPTRTA